MPPLEPLDPLLPLVPPLVPPLLPTLQLSRRRIVTHQNEDLEFDTEFFMRQVTV